MPLQPIVTEVERLLFCSDIAAVGAFRCSPTHGLFNESNPASGHLFVFPRTSTKILFAGGRTITATPALTIFYNRGQAYRRERIDGNGDSSDWFMIAEDVARDIVRRYDPAAADREKVFRFESGHAGGKLYLRQRRFHQQLASGAIDPIGADEAIINLFDAAVREAYGVRPRGSDPAAVVDRQEVVDNVTALIAARPAANLPLRDLAKTANCSPYYLCRIFRETTGYTITAYKHALRLHIALGGIGHGRDLTEVALSLGYASHSHFTSHFRRHFGVTPTDYRNAIALNSAIS